MESRLAAARRLCEVRRRHDARRAIPPTSSGIPPELRDRAFQLRPVWQRFLVVLAGPGGEFPSGDPDLRGLLHDRRSAAHQCRRRRSCRDTAAAAAGIQARRPDPRGRWRATRRPSTTSAASSLLRPNETVAIAVERGGRVTRGSGHARSRDTITDQFGKVPARGCSAVAPTTGVLERLPLYRGRSGSGRLHRRG